MLPRDLELFPVVSVGADQHARNTGNRDLILVPTCAKVYIVGLGSDHRCVYHQLHALT